jgi:thioredoxin-like negative regulator of GroEL
MLHSLLAAILPRRALNPARLQRKLLSLEQKAASATGAERAKRYLHLARLAADGHQRTHALGYYGHAVDAHLVAGGFEAAAALCREVIERYPTVVRARCTLAFLVLGTGRVAEATREIEGYVLAAQRAGRIDLAITRLRLMAKATDDVESRTALARFLRDLGDHAGYDEVYSALRAERTAPRAHREDQRTRWARMLRVDLTGPTRL